MIIAICRPVNNKSTSTNISCCRMNNSKSKMNCYGRINCITTCLQNIDTDLRCQWMRRRNHTVQATRFAGWVHHLG